MDDQLKLARRARDAARHSAYRASHKTEEAARHLAYRTSHKTEIAAHSAIYYASHKAERRAYNISYRASHKAQVAASQASYYAAHKAERNAYLAIHKTETFLARLKKLYGLSSFGYQRLLEQQRYTCARCGVGFGKIEPFVDHDHDTGQVRALLCHRCNIKVHRLAEINMTLRYLKMAQ